MQVLGIYRYIIIKVDNVSDVISFENIINKYRQITKSHQNNIKLYPNYLLFNIESDRYLFLSNLDTSYETLNELVISDTYYKPYKVIFDVTPNNLFRIKEILNTGKDIIKPTYKSKTIIKENLNYKYNGWVVFKTNNDYEKEYVLNSLDHSYIDLYYTRYPNYIFYNFINKHIINFDYYNDKDVINFINSINPGLDDTSKVYTIPQIFNYKDVLNIESIRLIGDIIPNYKPREIKKFESFLNEEVEPFLLVDWDNVKFKKEEEEKLKLEYIKELGKKGKLLDYVKKGETKLTFGILKSLFNDAIEYKKKRELTKGFYKFIHRAIPIALASIWFPVWLIAQILGSSRALNKLLIPVLKMNPSNYKSFLVTLITKTMDLMEGEIKIFMGDDWYYRVFMVDWGLIKMIRKEHIYNFALYVSHIMDNEEEDKIVPIYYIENQLRNWLNEQFNIRPPLPQKTEETLNESVDYNYIKNFID